LEEAPRLVGLDCVLLEEPIEVFVETVVEVEEGPKED